MNLTEKEMLHMLSLRATGEPHHVETSWSWRGDASGILQGQA